MTLISVEGNIGAGKSTLIESLKKSFPSVVFVDEPVEEWAEITDSNGVTILEKYYGDQKRYAFTFQMMAFITRVRRLRDAIKKNPGATIITERSVFTDREIFAKMLHDENKIEDIEYKIYLKWFDELVGDIKVDGVIYVRASPEVCLEHVIQRGRQGESIPLEYLKNCHEYHEDWLIEGTTASHWVCINPSEDQIRTLLQPQA